MPDRSSHCVGLSPSIDDRCNILILGSMPGEASLMAQEYYAHPSNRFWPLMAKLLNERDLPNAYTERISMLLRHHVALWDAIHSCDRAGSLDSDIRNAEANDFIKFLDKWKRIHTIGLNGGKAYAIFSKMNRSLFNRPDLRILKLPSTSPANARWRMDALLEAWKDLLFPPPSI